MKTIGALVGVLMAACFDAAGPGVAAAEPEIPGATVLPGFQPDPEARKRAAAIEELGKLGPRMPEAALKELLKALDAGPFSPEVLAAEAAFSNRGAEIVPRLSELIERGKYADRVGAAKALAAIGPPAKEAVPLLLAIVGDKSVEARRPRFLDADFVLDSLRAEAALAVGIIGGDAGAVTPKLVADHSFVRRTFAGGPVPCHRWPSRLSPAVPGTTSRCCRPTAGRDDTTARSTT